MQWKEITEKDQWNQALERSEQKPFVILKHSTACPVSANALNEFEAYLHKQPRADIDYLMVKVIETRPVSNQIAEDLDVKHASPQIIFVESRHPVWNASHWAITEEHMRAVLD